MPAAHTRLSFPTDDVRASDAEREEVAELLRTHAQAGRLEPDEHAERLDRVFAARMRSELLAPVADLPDLAAPPPLAAPTPLAARTRPASRPARPAGLRARLAGYVAVSLLLVAIWAATGAGAFWPVWFIAFGWFAVVGRAKAGGACGRRSRHHRASHWRSV